MTDNTNPPADDEKATPKRAPRRQTKASAAKAAREKEAATFEETVLAQAPTYQVLYPTGYSWHVGADGEVQYELGLDTIDEDAVDEHVTVPKGGRFRALNLAQLDELRVLASQGFLAASYAQVQPTE
jgi:hypothetical protein